MSRWHSLKFAIFHREPPSNPLQKGSKMRKLHGFRIFDVFSSDPPGVLIQKSKFLEPPLYFMTSHYILMYATHSCMHARVHACIRNEVSQPAVSPCRCLREPPRGCIATLFSANQREPVLHSAISPKICSVENDPLYIQILSIRSLIRPDQLSPLLKLARGPAMKPKHESG